MDRDIYLYMKIDSQCSRMMYVLLRRFTVPCYAGEAEFALTHLRAISSVLRYLLNSFSILMLRPSVLSFYTLISCTPRPSFLCFSFFFVFCLIYSICKFFLWHKTFFCPNHLTLFVHVIIICCFLFCLFLFHPLIILFF